MVETGQRALRSADHILAFADVLRVSPLYLADGRDDPLAAALRGPNTVPFPARCDPMTLARHQQLARQFSQIIRTDVHPGWHLSVSGIPQQGAVPDGKLVC